MTYKRRILVLGLILGIGAILTVAGSKAASAWMVSQLKRQLPFPAAYESSQWRWPFGVRIKGLSIHNPSGDGSSFLKVEELTLAVPWWGLLSRPIPIVFTFKAPHLMLNAENVNAIFDQAILHPPPWLQTPLTLGVVEQGDEEEALSVKPPWVAPFGFHISDGRLDVSSEQLRALQPLFSVAHIHAALEISGLLGAPTFTLQGEGRFVTQTGKPIGIASIGLKTQPRQNRMEGVLRLRHEQLEDFHLMYQYAPRPIAIEGGMADALIQWWLWDGGWLRVTARCLVRNLDLTGRVRDVSWGQILRAVEDDERTYEWAATAEGRLDDPRFNPHDQILSEVEWMMKEKAASRGLKIDGQMFFYEEPAESQGPSLEGEEAVQ